MLTEVTPAPISISATPCSFSSLVSTVSATASARKYLRDAIPSSFITLSMFATGFCAPENTLYMPSNLLPVTPITSDSAAWNKSSVEYDWATAP